MAGCGVCDILKAGWKFMGFNNVSGPIKCVHLCVIMDEVENEKGSPC